MAVISWIVLLRLVGLIVCLKPLIMDPPATMSDDYVLVDYRTVPRSFSRSCYSRTLDRGGSNTTYNACIAALPTQIFNNFSFELPKDGCGHLGNTSYTADNHNCTYATNGGFFDIKTGACVGNVISNGVIQQLTGSNRVNFGIANSSYVIGYLRNDTLTARKFNLSQLLSGAGWLVRSGISYINTSMKIEQLDDNFVSEKAPRTGICVGLNGTLVILQVDGEEDKKLGIDLFQFSDILVSIGCWEAVNLDGGGSSTSVYKGRVVNRPTCLDTPFICQRHVSTITCIKT